MDVASTSGGEETEATLRATLSVLEPDYEELYTISPPEPSDRVCHRGETNAGFMFLYAFLVYRLKVRLPFTEFERSVLKHYRVAPSQFHPNAWGFVKSFEILCGFLAVTPTVPLFSHFFDVCPRKAGERGWVSLRGHNGRPLLTLYVDLAKSSRVSFKRDFFKVVPKDEVLPFWRSSWEEQEPNFSIYWDSRHYDWGPRTYVTKYERLSSSEQHAFFLLQEAIKERGGTRYHSRIDLMKKAKVVGLDDPKARDHKKRKAAEGSSTTLSNSQSLAFPQATADPVLVPDPQTDRALGPSEADGKKRKSKVVTEDLAVGPKADVGSSSGVPMLTKAIIFDDDFSPDHPTVDSQFYTEEIRTKFMGWEFNIDQSSKVHTKGHGPCCP
ncbi:hypothetical protein SESBI_11126 [Sesbania bispinosa]|nr:hypothetical protein SESBI_11126 [Sesbania bispinosa]